MKNIVISIIFTLISVFTLAQDKNLSASNDINRKNSVVVLEKQTELSEENLTSNSSYSIRDNDENAYNAVKIGNQIWMAENLKTTKYNDGTVIPLVSDYNAWSNLTSAGFCWYRNDAESFKDNYGALYNGYTISTGKLCPLGWHVPSVEDWMILINYCGGDKAGVYLKEMGSENWISPNAGATNTTGFAARPGGSRGNYGSFLDIGLRGHWWSSSEYDKPNVWSINMSSFYSDVTESSDNKKSGLSVRCIKD